MAEKLIKKILEKVKLWHILVLYFLTRLWNLTLLPVFNSETISLLEKIHNEKLPISTYFISREDNLSCLESLFNLEKKFTKPDGVNWVGAYKLKDNIGY